jgi:DNA-binding phage protein
LRRDHLDLLRVRKDEWEVSEDVLEVMEDDESAQFLRAQRVIARSKRVARVPKRPPARRTELEDAVKAGVEDTADLCSAEWGTERVDSSSAV